jgi:hypothetical protein
MRRSSVVRLTLLPMLASATVVADPPSATPPIGVEVGPPAPPPDGYVLPGEPLAAPGMTPEIEQLDCENDPNWRLRSDCNDEVYWYDGGVVRGGFGGYFYGPRWYRGGGWWGGGRGRGGWAGGRGGWGGGHGGWGG